MSPLIQPVLNLMNWLSYRSKFALMVAVFSIPLILLAGRLAITFQEEAQQALMTKEGLNHLREASTLLRHMEYMRDTSVTNFVYADSPFSGEYKQAKERTIGQIRVLLRNPAFQKHQAFLTQLMKNIHENKISPGSEGARIHAIFENANLLIEQTFLWRLKLSYEFASSSNAHTDVIGLLDTYNNSYGYFIALGQARAFGAFYLQQKFISSDGIQLLDKNYLSFERLMQEVDLKSSERQDLWPEQKQFSPEALKANLKAAQSLVDDELLQVMTPDSDPIIFFNKLSDMLEVFYGFNNELLNQADTLLTTSYMEANKQLILFYIISAVILFTVTYLYLGFYHYIRTNIRDLVLSARRVSRGEYKQQIQIAARDELHQIANAMDQMRIKLKAREDELTRIGQTDGLTGLKNRKYFNEAFPLALASSSRNKTPLSIVLMDIDHFKNINDIYGHQIGDVCIQKAAELFKSQFKRRTDFAARYGGEEFIAVLCGLTEEETLRKTEDLKDKLSKIEIATDKGPLSMTASFGIAGTSGSQGVSEQRIIALADAKLYEAKRLGRNRIEVEPAIRSPKNQKKTED